MAAPTNWSWTGTATSRPASASGSSPSELRKALERSPAVAGRAHASNDQPRSPERRTGGGGGAGGGGGGGGGATWSVCAIDKWLWIVGIACPAAVRIAGTSPLAA